MKNQRATTQRIRLAALAILSLFIVLAAAAYVSGWQVQRNSELIATDAVPGTIAAHYMRMAMSRSIGWVMVAASAQTRQSRDANLKIVHNADLAYTSSLSQYEATIKIDPKADRILLERVKSCYADYLRKRKIYEALIISGDRNRSAVFLERELVPAYVPAIRSAEELLKYNHSNSRLYSNRIRDNVHRLHWAVAVVMVLALLCASVLVASLATRRREMAELQENEEKFSKAFQSNPSGIAITELETGRYIEVNDSFCEFMGYSPQELIGNTSVEMGIWSNAGERKRLFQPLLDGGSVRDFEMQTLTRDGTRKTILVNAELIELGGKRHVVSLINEITEQLQLTRLYSALSHVNQAIVTLHSREELFATICRVLVEFGSFRMAWIGSVDAETQRVMPVAQYGDSVEYLSQVKIYADDRPEGQGPTGTAIREGKCYICNDFMHISQALPWRKHAAEAGFRASAVFPIRQAGLVCGAITVYSEEAGYFREKEIALLEEVAGDTSFALDNLARDEGRREAEKRLRENEEKFSKAFQSNPSGIAITELKTGRYIEVNESFCRLVGYSSSELVGHTTLEMGIWASADDRQRTIQPLYNCDSLRNLEIQTRTRDGVSRTILLDADLIELGGERCIVTIIEDITERRRLERNQAELASIVESSDDAIIGKTLSGVITSWNGGAEKIFGYTEAEVIGQPLLILVPTERRHEEAEILAQIARGETVEHFDTVRVRKDGREIFISATISPLRDASGKVVGASKIARDVTSQRQVTEQLEMLKTSVDKHFDGAYWMDTDNRFVYVNDSGCKALGYTREEMLGKPLSLIASNATPQGLQEVWMQLRETGFLTRESLHRRKNGSEFPVEIAATLVRFEGREFNCGFARDITERKQAEKELREKQAQLVLAMDIAKLAHWEFDVARNIVTGDEELFHLLGTTSAEVGGPSMSPDDYIRIFVHPLDAGIVAGEVALGIATTDPHFARQFEHRIIRKDGTEGVMLTRSRIVMDATGRTGRIHGTNQDITEQKQAEAELKSAYLLLQEERQSLAVRVEERTVQLSETNEKLARADQAKSEFLSRMSHELRTPLNAILGFGQLLQMDELPDEQAESIERILTAGQHLLKLINEVLDIARVESGRLEFSLEPVSVREVLQEAVSLVQPLAAARGIDIGHAHPVEAFAEYYIQTDRQRVTQVLLNLLGNAIKYNRPEGSVTYGVSVIQPAEDASTPMLRINVHDTGPGIPAEKMERLFVPFDRLDADQTRIEGTGLGLTLARQLVVAMSGAMGVESEPGRGSTFWFELPLVEAVDLTQDLDTVPLPETSADGVHGIVLYIEDNLSNLELVEKILNRYPIFKCVSAMQGRLGIDMARSQLPDLILLDLHLPDMHGSEVLALLRDDPLTREIPVVILSADATPSQVERMIAAGAQDYLTKPIDVPRLLRILEDNLRKKGLP